MLNELAAALNDTTLAQTLRASLWLYPLVNTAHVVGIALLFGAIVPLDLRLLGAWPRVAVAPLARVLVPVAIAGLLLAIASGALLFVTRAPDYVHEPLFGIKMGLLAVAVLNALWLRRAAGWGTPGFTPHGAARVAGLLSIVLWLLVITAGRLIGYR